MYSVRKRLYKPGGVNVSLMRRRREDTGLQLRKEKREQQRSKRRNGVPQHNPCNSSSDGATGVEENEDEVKEEEIFNQSVEQILSTMPYHQQPHQQQSQQLQDNQDEQHQYEIIPASVIIESLYSDDITLQRSALKAFCLLLSFDYIEAIDDVIEAGVVPRFVQLLKNNENPSVQFVACWALTIITAGVSEQTNVVIEAGAVLILVDLLSSPEEEVQVKSAWALGNIAGDSSRDFLLDSGILLPILGILDTTQSLQMMRIAVWTLSNLCRRKYPDVYVLKMVDVLSTLRRFLNHTDPEILRYTCWALSYISESREQIQAVINAGVCPLLVKLLKHSKNIVVTPALRAIGNIVTGDGQQMQVILDCNVLPVIGKLLNSPRRHTRQEACCSISNIAAGNFHQIQELLDANIFPILIKIMDKDKFATKKEAVWALMNATCSGTPEQIRYLVRIGCIKRLCDVLMVLDSNIVKVALDALENILKIGKALSQNANPYAVAIEECGGLDKIEVLEAHENAEIYQHSCRIVEQYFGYEDEVEQVAASEEFTQHTCNADAENPQGDLSF